MGEKQVFSKNMLDHKGEKMIQLSFIIPVYNCKNTLVKCINSIREIDQSYKKEIEIIIVDDGSTDGSSELCDIYGDVVIHQINTGVAAARNAGIRVAKGEYIVFADADDFFETNELSAVIRILKNNVDIDVLVYGTWFEYYNKKKCYRVEEMLPSLTGKKWTEECRNMIYELYKSNTITPVWNKVIKRALVIHNEIWFRQDMFIYEDMEYSLQILNASGKWFFYKKPIYHYNQQEAGRKMYTRLNRLKNTSELVNIIGSLLPENTLEQKEQSNRLLISMFTVLLREKIAVASPKTVYAICTDFSEWINEHSFYDQINNNEYAKLVYEHKVNKLILKKVRSDIRHKVAVVLKSIIGDFRRYYS